MEGLRKYYYAHTQQNNNKKVSTRVTNISVVKRNISYYGI